MATKRDNKKTVLDNYMEKMEKLADKITTPPMYPEYKQPEPIGFSNDPGTLETTKLVDELLQVLDGHTIEEISFASNIVEQYVKAQSKGQMI